MELLFFEDDLLDDEPTTEGILKRVEDLGTLTSPDISCQSESFLVQLQRPRCIILGYPHPI